MNDQSANLTGIQRIITILEMIRFSHTIFALPFALLSAVMCWTVRPIESLELKAPSFEWMELLGIVLCMVFARSAAMAFNRVADNEIDRENPRTQEAYSGWNLKSEERDVIYCHQQRFVCVGDSSISPKHAAIYLSVPVLAFLCLYSYTKRFTSLAHSTWGLA